LLVQPFVLVVAFTFFISYYLPYFIESPAAVAMAGLKGGPAGLLPNAPPYKEL
jgi:hypothetical protein